MMMSVSTYSFLFSSILSFHQYERSVNSATCAHIKCTFLKKPPNFLANPICHHESSVGSMYFKIIF